jgi:hypothetical protein
MKSLKEWRKAMGLLEDEAEEMGERPPMERKHDESWQNLKMLFGPDRQLANPEILRMLKSVPLNDTHVRKLLDDYQNDKDRLAKDIIIATLKIIFGEEAGAGRGVSGREMQAAGLGEI